MFDQARTALLCHGRARGALALGIAVSALLLSGSPPLARTAPAVALGAARTPEQQLQSALQSLVGMRHGPPGVVAVVQREGAGPVVFTAGVRELGSATGIPATDRMRLASVSKAFSGAAALALVTKGKLSLSDTIGERLPGLPPAWASVTLRELLQHTSGLPDYSQNEAFLTELKQDPRRYFAPQTLLRFVAGQDLEFTPGSRYAYSNSDNVAVALMVQNVTGRSYAADLERLVYRPLGLERTSLPSGFAIPAPFIHGYDVSGERPLDVSTVLSVSSAWASGGMVSTPGDLNTFIRAYLARRLFSAAVQNHQLRFVTGSSEPPGPGVNAAGLAIFRYQTSCGTVYGHTGSFPGYTQFAAASRNGKQSVTVSASTQLSLTSGEPRVLAALRRAEGLAVCVALGR